jgi:hypothetical protein
VNGAPDAKPDGGDSAKIVEGFRAPGDAFLSMAKLHPGEAHTWGIFLARHAGRKTRNAHRVRIARLVAEATRSEEAWGSHEAANVARGNPPTPGGMLDKILDTAIPTKAPTSAPTPDAAPNINAGGAA